MSTHVYVISASDQAQKVGIADDPRGRLMGMQTGCPLELKLVLALETRDALVIEQRVHRLFADHRIRGEWFAVSPVEAIQAVAVAALGRHNEFVMSGELKPIITRLGEIGLKEPAEQEEGYFVDDDDAAL